MYDTRGDANVTESHERIKRMAYWGFTLWVGLVAVGPGVLDLLDLPPVLRMLLHLGYPRYFADLLGAWKVLGGIVLLLPGCPLVKEWAYAGMFFEFSSAVVSHIAVGDGAVAVLWPSMFAAVLVASWSLRPPSRRLTLRRER